MVSQIRRNQGKIDVAFTSTSIPMKQGLEGSCEIPLGFVITPMASSTPFRNGAADSDKDEFSLQNTENLVRDNITASNVASGPLPAPLPQSEMELCTTCLAYLNLYCPIDPKTGLWTCPFCESQNVTSSPNVINSVVSTPTVEYHQTAASPFSPSSNGDAGNYGGELGKVDVIEDEVIMIVLDGNLPENEVQSIMNQLTVLLKKNDAIYTARIGLVVYTSVVNVYQVGLVGIASADVYSPTFNPMGTDSKERMYLGSFDGLRNCVSAYFDLLPNKTFSGGADANKNESNDGVDGGCAGKSELTEKEETNSSKPLSSRRKLLRSKREERLKKEKNGGNDNGSTTKSSEQMMEPKNDIPAVSIKNKHPSQRLQKRCTFEAVLHAMEIISSSDSRSGRVLVFTNGCPNVGRGSVVKSSSITRDERQSLMDRFDGKKDEASRQVLRQQQQQQRGDKVDPDMLDDAARVFYVVGEEGIESGIGVDVFFTGCGAVLGVPALQALVHPSGGYVLSHDSFADKQFRSNLSFVWNETFMSRTAVQFEEYENVNDIDSNMTEKLQKVPNSLNTLKGCIVDIRMSPSLVPTHIIGPGKVLHMDEEIDEYRHCLPNEQAAFEKNMNTATELGLTNYNLPCAQTLASSLTQIRIGRYDPLSTLSVVMQVVDEEHLLHQVQQHRFVYFQFVVRYVESNPTSQNDEKKKDTLVTRIYTHRLPLTESIHDFIEGLNDEVVPIVLGRVAACRSMTSIGRADGLVSYRHDIDRNMLDFDDPLELFAGVRMALNNGDEEMLACEVRKDLDATVHRISRAFRLNIANQQDPVLQRPPMPTNSSLDFAFPPELAGTVTRLLHLRRGRILGVALQSCDDRDLERERFLRFPLEDSLSMITPSLWSYTLNDDGSIQFQSVPPETLVLWDDCVIAADHYDSLFVWSGQSTLKPQYDILREMCKEFLLKRCQNRFPMPTVHFLSEGDSMSRRLTVRLIPSHGDPPEHQVAHFLPLAKFSPEELQKLRNKFRLYDPTSDASFWKWFWDVVSASSKAGEEGHSLSE